MEVEISVVIPIYSNPVYLEKTLESLEAQTNNNFETIAVLDRAEPWVIDLLAGKKIKNREIKVLVSEISGISAALMMGIKKARGELIARIDSDDTMQPSRLDTQFEYLGNNPNIDIVGSQINFIDEAGLKLGESCYPGSPKAIDAILPLRNCVAHPSVMMRRSIFTYKIEYKSEFNGVEDYELWLSALGKFPIVNLPEKLTNYRVWGSQVTSTEKEGRKHLEKLARGNYLIENGSPQGSFKFWRIIKSAEQLDKVLGMNTNGKLYTRMYHAMIVFGLSPIRITHLTLDMLWSLKNK